MKKEIIVVLRSPFLDKIPSLKTLIWYLANHGCNITIISVQDSRYPVCIFNHPNIQLILIKQRDKKLELPTSFKLLIKCIRIGMSKSSPFFIGGDSSSNRLLCMMKKATPIRYINFLLEYPDIHPTQKYQDLKCAKYIITHDKWHGDFLMEHCSIKEKQLLFLPNSTYTEETFGKTYYLHDKLNIPYNKLIILHSGGLGKWFQCQELALSTKNWPENTTLVFHTSHQVESTAYYQDMVAKDFKGKVLFSTKPVDTSELDTLVASAGIGVATYSIRELDYRAKYMGLAAGKIGNYLKCGIPVIATKVSSLNYIEDYRCGVLIDDLSEMAQAISTICNDYNTYVNNAHTCYQQLWQPEPYLKEILKTLYE